MERAHPIEGLGWVDAASRRFVLPRSSAIARGGASLAAPSTALPFELVERVSGPMAIVRGAAIDPAQRAEVRACLANVVADVGFLLASERGVYLVDVDTDVLACVDALDALARGRGLEASICVWNGERGGFLDAELDVPLAITRDREAVARAYESAATSSVIRADVDRLMVYNDWLGVAEGDLLIGRVVALAMELARGPKAASAVCVSVLRRQVLLVAAGVDARAARALADAVVDGVRRLRVQLRHPEVRNVPYMTISAGAAWVADTRSTPLERALDEADAAVQRAKLEGRDRACLSSLER